MQNSRPIQACFLSKSTRFESTNFASVMIITSAAADVIRVPSVKLNFQRCFWPCLRRCDTDSRNFDIEPGLFSALASVHIIWSPWTLGFLVPLDNCRVSIKALPGIISNLDGHDIVQGPLSQFGFGCMSWWASFDWSLSHSLAGSALTWSISAMTFEKFILDSEHDSSSLQWLHITPVSDVEMDLWGPSITNWWHLCPLLLPPDTVCNAQWGHLRGLCQMSQWHFSPQEVASA